ncbi:hypothetical protein, partial [Pseudomonas gessardii]|uniref:hypothetical protein n=1 Tax=Pseudomonas gessardii TaxID=78544 RepID=UPI001F1E4ADB
HSTPPQVITSRDPTHKVIRISLQKNAYMDVSVIVQPFRTFRGQTYFDQKKHQQPRKSKQTARYLQEMPLARVTPRV